MARGAVYLVLLIDAALLAVFDLLFLTVHIGSVAAPFTVLVAGVTNVWLTAGAARMIPRAGIAAGPVVLWTVLVGLLGLVGPGGDTLLPDDWRSLLLLAAGVIPSAPTLGRLVAEGASRR